MKLRTGQRIAAGDHERSDAALWRSEAFLAQAQRVTKTGSLWWRPSTGEVVWSEESYRIMEYPLGKTPTVGMAVDRCHPEDRSFVEDTITTAVRDGVSVDFEHRLRMPDGAIKYVRVVLQPIASDGGDLELLGAATDITDWKLAAEKLRQSEAHLAELRAEIARAARVTSFATLAASIAHEVNQPLSGVVTNASTCLRMLANDPPDIEGARETARRTIRDGTRASEVVSRVRALLSRNTLRAERVNLNDATREVVDLWRSELLRGRTTVRLDLSDNLPSAKGDRIQLQQVIVNLLRNGMDAMRDIDDRPREIVIETRADEAGAICVSVSDAGTGFKRDDAEKLFDPFYSTKRDGMGIGLFVSRSIIERHHGRIWAHLNDGAGSTFCFTIPCDASDGIE